MQKAVITGITGQDGSYMTELLISKGYEVHGILRRASMINRPRLDHLTMNNDLASKQLFLHYADLEDITTVRRLITRIQPHEFYHFAGQSHVGLSFDIPESTADFTAMGTLRLLEILRDLPAPPRFLNIGSSEIFGNPTQSPQNELTPMNPVNPYGVAKAFAVQMTRIYRESHGLFCCNAISYNHESPRRGQSFVTRKITHAAARIKLGLQNILELGNIHSGRDWGFAGDYVMGMWQILQHHQPDDFILATGQLTTLKDFLELTFRRLDLNYEDYLQINPRFLRPVDSTTLVGDASKARQELGWTPQTSLDQLIDMMLDQEFQDLQMEGHPS